MALFLTCIEEKTVYPILIRNNGKKYLTLYYYSECSDSILHRDAKQILYFQSTEAMQAFCRRNDLQTESAIVEYDFDAPIGNPIDFTRILNNWNLLNTIAATLGIPFEGDSEKYTSLYDLLFGLNTPVDPISPLYQVCEADYKDILAVFRKKDRFLNLLELYREE